MHFNHSRPSWDRAAQHWHVCQPVVKERRDCRRAALEESGQQALLRHCGPVPPASEDVARFPRTYPMGAIHVCKRDPVVDEPVEERGRVVVPKDGKVGAVDAIESQQAGPETVAPRLGPDDTNVPKLEPQHANRGGEPSAREVPSTREPVSARLTEASGGCGDSLCVIVGAVHVVGSLGNRSLGGEALRNDAGHARPDHSTQLDARDDPRGIRRARLVQIHRVVFVDA